jgi:hypothetical protein
VTSEIDLRASRMAISNAIGHAKFFSRSHDAVIRVYDEAGNVIKTHEQAGEFKAVSLLFYRGMPATHRRA